MRTNLLLSLSAVLISTTTPAAVPVQAQSFLQRGNTSQSHVHGESVFRRLPDNSQISAGWASEGGDLLPMLVKSRYGELAPGNYANETLWACSYPDVGWEAFLDARVAADGHILACGELNTQPWLVKIDESDGSILWQKELLTSGSFFSVAALADGSIAAGFETDDILVARFDTAGNLLWSRRYGWPGSTEAAQAVRVHASGDLFVSGFTSQLESPGTWNLLALRLDSQGNLLWANNIGKVGQSEGPNMSMDLFPSGESVLIGSANGGAPFQDDALVLRLDAAGDVLWTQSLDLGTRDRVAGVAATSNDGCVILGDFAAPFGQNLWLSRLAADGSVDWTRHIDHPSGFSAVASEVETTPLDGILVGGVLTTGSYVSHRLESDGTSAWSPCNFIMSMVMTRSTESVDEDRSSPPTQSTNPLVLNSTAVAVTEPWGWSQNCIGCQVNVRTLGQGTVGSGGFVPVLTGQEGLCEANGGRTLDIAGGLGGTSGLLFIGINTLPFPLFGGTFHVDLSAPWFPLNVVLGGTAGVPGAGTWTHVSNIELRPFLGTDLYFQTLLIDPGAPRGITLTNAVHWYVGN